MDGIAEGCSATLIPSFNVFAVHVLTSSRTYSEGAVMQGGPAIREMAFVQWMRRVRPLHPITTQHHS